MCTKRVKFFLFPPLAACIDWDPELRLLAVGTKGGSLRIFGAPGVELLGQHEGEELTVLRHVNIIINHPNSLTTILSNMALHPRVIWASCVTLNNPGFFLFPGKADWSHSHQTTASISGK